MKSILTIILSFLLVVSGLAQTRNVVVGTNDVIVSPTNFWNANASNNRLGLSLGSAATNPASAFQPSSSVLSNLASSNAVNLTNLRLSNIVGWSAITNTNSATTLLGYNTNGQVVYSGTNTLTFTNMLNLNGGISENGILIWNSTDNEFYAGATFHGEIAFGGTNAAVFAATTRTNLGLGTTNDVEFNQLRLGGSDQMSIQGAAGNISFYDGIDSEIVLQIPADTDPVVINSQWNDVNVRSNLGLGWSALTNTNAGTGLVSVNSNGSVVSPTNFWQAAPIQTTVYTFAPITNASTNISGARNIYVYSLATNITGVTATINLPTNGTTFSGDTATIIHRATTSSITTVKQSTNTIVSISNYDDAVKLINENGTWKFYHNISFAEPIKFIGTNSALNIAQTRTNLGLGETNSLAFANMTVYGQLEMTDGQTFYVDGGIQIDAVFTFASDIRFSAPSVAATTRTNLGIPLAALTNTNNASFQRSIFQTNTTPASAANLSDVKAWIEISLVTNNVTNNFRIPAFQ